MIKTRKTLVIGALAMGLFLGSGSLINPSIASAATADNHQPAIGSQQFTGGQPNAQQSGTIGSVRYDLSKQGIQKQNLSFNSIISQASNLIGVSRKVVLDGVEDGSTLVEIAKDNDVSDASILTKLRHLQKALDACFEPGQVNDKPSTAFMPKGNGMNTNMPNPGAQHPGTGSQPNGLNN